MLEIELKNREVGLYILPETQDKCIEFRKCRLDLILHMHSDLLFFLIFERWIKIKVHAHR